MSWLQPHTLRRLGALTPARFLKEHWQRQPLFIKGAIPEIAGLLDGDDLAGLALEEDVESRLVLRQGPPARAGSWQLRHGPFTEADFRKLPAKDWTLLVQAVDHRLPQLAELLDRFSFLPQWRIDDVMVSYAVDGGGVGPHFDSYDVFLIQGLGTRVWKVGPAVGEQDLLPHPDLRILKTMPVTQEYVCEPGDILYLPPGIAHWGVARGDCMTWSVGFRAPADRELLDALCNYLGERIPESQRYGDAGIRPAVHPGELDAATLTAFRRRLTGLLDQPGLLADFLGRAFSEPKYAGQEPPAPERRYTAATLRRLLAGDGEVRRNEGSRLLLVRGDGDATLYHDGQPLPLGASPTLAGLAAQLADQRVLPRAALLPALDDPAAAALLLALFNSGHLYATEAS